MRCARGLTLFELVAVLVMITVLLGAALPGYLSEVARARVVADEAAVDSVRTALILSFVEHRRHAATRNDWVTTLDDIAAAMEGGRLPKWITVSGQRLRDQRGNEYLFIPETELAPAKLVLRATGAVYR